MNVVESLEWLTDVFAAKRREERRCLRYMPRIVYTFKYILRDAEYGESRELARVTGGDPIYVPDWTNETVIPTVYPGTASLPIDATFAPAYLSGGAALIWDSNTSYEVVTVSAVGSGTISISATTATHHAPSVIPLRLGTFAQKLQGDRGPHSYTHVQAVFECVVTEDLSGVGGGIGYPTYAGYQVITDVPEIINGAQESNVREVDVLDSMTGPIYKYPIFATPNQSAFLAWTCYDAQDVWNRRLWLHSKKGKWKQFWTSSWNADVTITSNINPGDATIEIASIGFATKYPDVSDWMIASTSGGGWFVQVIGATAGSSGHELLRLADHFPGSAGLSGIDKMCKLTLSRLDSDKIDIQHLPGRQATIVVATKEVSVYP
jgi:hypothetical protein